MRTSGTVLGLPPNGFLQRLLLLYSLAQLPCTAPALTEATTTLLALDAAMVKTPLVDRDFPDPSLVQDTDGSWYAFATAGGDGSNIQVARAPSPAGPWTYLDGVDPLPDTGNWTDGHNSWAPDVRVIADGRYVMYYSGEVVANVNINGNNNNNASNTSESSAGQFHCIGAATATTVLGPYAPLATPFACPLAQGGAIDPAGFLDRVTGRRYVVYKIDGNSVGRGGSCNNGVAPFAATPIVLQEVSAADGVTLVSGGDGDDEPAQLLDRSEGDGPLVEAPSLIWIAGDGQGDEQGEGGGSGVYVLFYSSHCWDTPGYNVKYATAANITGPYTRAESPLIATGDFNTTSPGGATSVDDGGALVFHANCGGGRCMFGATFTVAGTNATVGRRRSRARLPLRRGVHVFG